MIDEQTIEKIKQLLYAGKWPQRTIAKKLDVSRATVSRIAARYRRHKMINMPKQKRKRCYMQLHVPQHVERCLTCGALVQLPCRGCEMQMQQSSIRRAA